MTDFEIIESDYAPQLMTYDGKTIALELKKTVYAESRLHDIQTSNPGTLPELTTVFLKSCHELNRALGVISTQLSLIKHKKEVLRSHLLIEKVPAILEQTKQRSSEDLRNALIEMDPEYQKFKEWSLMLEAAFNNLKDKRKVVEMAYFSCQKIAELKNIYQPTGSPNYGNYDAVEAGSDASWA